MSSLAQDVDCVQGANQALFSAHTMNLGFVQSGSPLKVVDKHPHLNGVHNPVELGLFFAQ